MASLVKISDGAKKDLARVPDFICRKLMVWIGVVELLGLQVARQIKGFHDDPLMGRRFGQRSIRLNRSYRAIYRLRKDARVEVVVIIEVHKHDY